MTRTVFRQASSYFPQAYFLGCSFDTWTRDPVHQSYVFLLVAVGFVLPLVTIVLSYVGIYNVARTTRKSVMGKRHAFVKPAATAAATATAATAVEGTNRVGGTHVIGDNSMCYQLTEVSSGSTSAANRTEVPLTGRNKRRLERAISCPAGPGAEQPACGKRCGNGDKLGSKSDLYAVEFLQKTLEVMKCWTATFRKLSSLPSIKFPPRVHNCAFILTFPGLPLEGLFPRLRNSIRLVPSFLTTTGKHTFRHQESLPSAIGFPSCQSFCPKSFVVHIVPL